MVYIFVNYSVKKINSLQYILFDERQSAIYYLDMDLYIALWWDEIVA